MNNFLQLYDTFIYITAHEYFRQRNCIDNKRRGTKNRFAPQPTFKSGRGANAHMPPAPTAHEFYIVSYWYSKFVSREISILDKKFEDFGFTYYILAFLKLFNYLLYSQMFSIWVRFKNVASTR